MKREKKDIGIDELNFIEVPITLLGKNSQKDNLTLQFADKQNNLVRHWKLIGSRDRGFPIAADEEIFIALLFLTKETQYKSNKIYFTPYVLFNIMKWQSGGLAYKRLKRGLERLLELTIYTSFMWNKGEFQKPIGELGFHLLSDFYIPGKNKGKGYIVWGDTIFNSLKSGNIKLLDLDIYYNLKTPISKRFYRLWTKRAYKNPQLIFNLRSLCFEKLGLKRTTNKSYLLKQALSPALKEQISKKLLSKATFQKDNRGEWLLQIEKYIAPKKQVFQKITPLRIKSNNVGKSKSDAGLSSSIFQKVEKIIEKMPPGKFVEELELHRKKFLREFPQYLRFKDSPALDQPLLDDYMLDVARGKGWKS